MNYINVKGYKDGKEIQRLTGVQKKADLEKFISENV